jgi:hypothetical protein
MWIIALADSHPHQDANAGGRHAHPPSAGEFPSSDANRYSARLVAFPAGAC